VQAQAEVVEVDLSSEESRTLGEIADYSIPDIVSAARLVRFIRELGHLDARIDPLGSKPPGDPGLDLDAQGLTREKLAELPASVVRSPLAASATNALEAIDMMRTVYCGTIGYEDDHVQVHEERAWVRKAAETRRFFQDFDATYKRELLERLTEVESFEQFLHQVFPGQKRFSIEGNDMLIPMLDSIIHHAAMADTHEVVIGMAHRGRLNVLAHILGKTYSAILAEFQGPNYYNKGTYLGWTGDVKYHLGARRAYREGGIFEMPLTLAPNPSHLESVNPVVEGRARAAQERREQAGEPVKDPNASLPILIHGDASFPGQGVVAETLNLSRLVGYHVGGTIHIIINNQIGFTTNWRDSRSTLYASDLAKGFEIPIVHVNADDPYACVAAARMAWAYRQHFKKDFLIDLVGYRRWGHNEGDEPSFTQPLMYQRISSHPTVRELWARTLCDEGVVGEREVEGLADTVQSRLKRAQREVERGGRIEATMAVPASVLHHRPFTEPHPVSREWLLDLEHGLMQHPEGFGMSPKLERLFERRHRAVMDEGTVDWAHAELLAFATILADGIPVRLTGQDAERGTFSQRHLVLHDVESGQRYVPLQHVVQAQASFAVYNSPLSENAALAFEYGYSSHAPDTLVLWEAQFGDFCNGAQVVIDQFLVSGSAKWGHTPALVLLLPHGYEGQGPEHSSARLERFLQLSADNNIRVVNCTTAAQYFHVLRRQAAMLQSDPRPLVIMTPKSLLRNPYAASSLDDLAEGRFQPVLPPASGSDSIHDVVRLILCSGKVYFDLLSGEYGTPKGLPEKIAAARVEELYPFPINELEFIVRNYRNLREIVWLQEEPQNMGAWTFMEPRLRELLHRSTMQHNSPVTITYCGRPESASPAEGSLQVHRHEQARFLHEVRTINS
jgi:2-oxoglutarate dehydrogenase E1 component